MEKSNAKRIIQKGLSYTSILLIAIIGLIFIFIAYQSFKHPDEVPSMFGYQSYAVLSNSMSPHFDTGDMVIIDKVDPYEINIHDVITFHQDGKLITHRVTDIYEQDGKVSFATKGDNNNVGDDEAVSGDRVIGQQVFQIPKMGYLMHFIKSPMGLFSLIALPLIGYLLLELYSLIKRYRINGDLKKQSTKE
ncbi:signal peptidase I [Sporosarcina sp. G11-34]|uniref:signal peptidase I n=1 Tax=Sporosarcina sp. G11-34 TaxID=2849605 RepID=UPI0022A8F205|nr:signal peptidase I [Sporosarcina sp. G11-34]MCZ2256950.1 signal peptidase I [Sporosarcina sp. G11-34]